MSDNVIAGGNGFRWRGKAIRTLFKQGSTCVTMPRKASTIMIPTAVIPNAQYKITITACKNSGNGAALVNFFGGKNYDGQYISLNINSSEMREYSVAVQSPNHPTNLQVYLRIWRPNDASGNVLVKLVQCSLIGSLNTPANIPKEPKSSQTADNYSVDKKPEVVRKEVVKNKKPAPINKKNKPKEKVRKGIEENSSMKFKPYNAARSTDMANKVMIKKVDDAPKVSIITPTRDGIELIKRCYNALVKNTDYPNWEWIVGDSMSTDGTSDWFAGLNDERVKFIQRGTTEGSFSSINNELASHADGEYLLFLNDDTEPQPFWLYGMVSKIHQNPDIGIVGAKLLYGPDRIQHAGIAFIPEGPANLGKAVLSAFPQGFANHDRFYQAVTGACLLLRRSDFIALNGFDLAYYFCYEDVDLCLRMSHSLNKKILYSANSIVIHAESVTQKKHRTCGKLQQDGIAFFKQKWMGKVEIDFTKLQKRPDKNVYNVDISFVTCVNNIPQFRNYVIGSLFKNNTNKNYEIIPILNFGNPYSAAQALNIGISKARANIVVLCHQDVLFYENWVEMLFSRIAEVESITPKWGVLGTAGITNKDDCIGVVHSIKGTLQWQSTKRVKVYEVQTVDEHCMIINKKSGLRFDEKIFNGFHFYGPDLCLSAASAGFKNFGILCPLVHDSSSGSLVSGKTEFMRLLSAFAKKWKDKFKVIRTPTSVIRGKSVRTFINFK